MEIWVHSILGSILGNYNKYLGIKTRVGTCTLVIYMAGSKCNKYNKYSIYSKYNIYSRLPNYNYSSKHRINPPSGRRLVEIDWIEL